MLIQLWLGGVAQSIHSYVIRDLIDYFHFFFLQKTKISTAVKNWHSRYVRYLHLFPSLSKPSDFWTPVRIGSMQCWCIGRVLASLLVVHEMDRAKMINLTRQWQICCKIVSSNKTDHLLLPRPCHSTNKSGFATSCLLTCCSWQKVRSRAWTVTGQTQLDQLLVVSCSQSCTVDPVLAVTWKS